MLIATAILLLAPAPLPAQQFRLIDQEPFDQLTLVPGPAPSVPEGQEAKPPDPVVLKLRPLEISPRRPLVPGQPDEEVRVRLFERPEKQYEVAWRHIQEVRLFEELVLAEAAALVERQRFDEAYPFYVFLEGRDAEFPGVAAGIQLCLFREASYWHKQNESAAALALLHELYRRNPAYDKLPAALNVVVDKLAGEHLAAGRYSAVRLLLRGLAEKFPDQPAIAAREAELRSLAEAAVAAARAAAAAGDFAAAHGQVRRALAIWPEVAGARQLALDLQGRYAIVEVGVTQLAGPQSPRWDWAARRARRLRYRTLVELVGFGGQEGQYECPLGSCQTDGATLTFRLREGLRWPDGGELTGFDVVQSVLSGRSDGGNFAARIASAEATDSRGAVFTLAGPHFQPLSLFDVALRPWFAGASSTAALGPYRPGAAAVSDTPESNAVRYLVQEKYFAHDAAQPREIVERFFDAPSAAAGALVAGEVSALDRVAPWDVARLRGETGLVVEPYAAPTVHLLVPNVRRPPLSSAAFRRALFVGLDRRRILAGSLLRGGDASRGQVLGSLLSAAEGAAESAADYDPGLMLALAGVALEQSPAAATGWPRLVLAHPPSETARRACLAIQEQWQLAGRGFAVELKELPPGAERDGDWDLLYVEWPLFDAAVDVAALLGAGGLAEGGSPWLEAALRRLAAAATPEDARGELSAIDRIVAEETLVLPLWRIAEHCAYRRSLSGVGSRPATLYQNVEGWRYAPEATP